MSEDSEANIKLEIKWQNVLFFIYLHMSALYGFLLIFTQAKLATIIFALLLVTVSMLSVTLGCHRLWTHQTYQAAWLTKLFFVFGHTLMCQGSVYDWVLDHRLHHKYHGTEMDPYNYKRGFLFSQIWCRIVHRNPEIEKAARDVDMSDIEEDAIVMWQKTLYWVVMPAGLFFSLNVPIEYWDESILVSIFVVGFFRLAMSLHCAWLINSATVLWGLDPRDRRSADSNLVFLVNKSLWPQYHYILPWDYQSGEYGNYGDGLCNAMVRIFAALGWIYNLRTVDANGLRKALYESSSSEKPLLKCLEDNQVIPTFEGIINYMNKSRKLR